MSILVLWPLLTPLGAFSDNLQAGDIELPWASIAGFADVGAIVEVVWWLAWRRQRRHALPAAVERPVDRTSRLHVRRRGHG